MAVEPPDGNTALPELTEVALQELKWLRACTLQALECAGAGSSSRGFHLLRSERERAKSRLLPEEAHTSGVLLLWELTLYWYERLAPPPLG